MATTKLAPVLNHLSERENNETSATPDLTARSNKNKTQNKTKTTTIKQQ